MKWHPEDERRWAVARIAAGDSVTAVAAALHRSRDGVYTWCTRACTGDPTWNQDRSHRPLHPAGLTPAEVVEAVTLGYDPANRRTSLVLPNGGSTEYVYDLGSRLTALMYRNARGPLGDLQYSYDATGNRTGVGGSFARSLLPDTLPSASYDSANRQLTFSGTTMTFDDNGNLASLTTGGQTSTYTWDNRNRLTAIGGASLTASFAYDAFGRRAVKTINGQATRFRYDGLEVALEDGPAGLVAYLRSLALDEALARTDETATSAYLADALGGTVGLTDASGTAATTYTYAPFGDTATTGASSANPFQFTGRENDGTGLYYYRARYYDPRAGRYLAEDPIGPIGGINRYSYAANNPSRYTDASGLIPGVPEIPDGLDNVPAALIAVVYSEATKQNYDAKLAVASVVKNRLTDSTHEFRKLYTYEQVIYQKYAYEAVGSGRFSFAMQVLSGRKPRNPSSLERARLTEAFRAAQAIGPYDTRVPDTAGGSLYFYSPYITQPGYIAKGLQSGTLEQFSPAGVSPNDFLFYRYAR